MRKLLITVLIIILIGLLAIMATSGINIGKFEIVSITKISDENKKLDEQIANLDKTINNDYVVAKTNIDASYKKLQNSKQRYQDRITYSTEDEIKAANQSEKYEIGYLWTKIGLYATKNNVVMQANVSNGSLKDLYNISFTATGEYIAISEFIYAIENDSNLGFKIENFTLVPNSEAKAGTSNVEKLKATFMIKNVPIDKDSLTTAGAINTQTKQNTQ